MLHILIIGKKIGSRDFILRDTTVVFTSELRILISPIIFTILNGRNYSMSTNEDHGFREFAGKVFVAIVVIVLECLIEVMKERRKD